MNEHNEATYAIGLGAEPAVISLAKDSNWNASDECSRITALTFNGKKLIIIWRKLVNGFILAISEAPNETVFEFVATVDFAYDIFEHLLTDPFDGMTVVDKDAIVRFISPIHEQFFGHKHGDAIGEPVEKIIENTRLPRAIQTGKAEVGHIQRLRGADRIVSRTPIFRDQEIVGAVGRVMFRDPQRVTELNQRIMSLKDEVEFYKREANAIRQQDVGIDNMIGMSGRMRDLKNDIIRVAPLDVPVLIVGESGSGKELVAQSLHRLSSRRDRNMIMLNAAALPATLVESELFGYSSGAFTGAQAKGHTGKFEQADNSTLFLDEIGDMPMETQAKLLRVLQSGFIERLGGTQPIKTNFRLVSATNRDIEHMVEHNEFRLDLYYRISPVVLRVPPLRDRSEDIPLFAEEFLRQFAARHQRSCCTLKESAVTFLKAQHWPGNIRELKNVIERAAIFSVDGCITADSLRQGRPNERFYPEEQDSVAGDLVGQRDTSLKARLERVELEAIEDALTRCRGNKKKAAEQLGISRSYLYKRISETMNE